METYEGPLRDEPLAIELHNTVYAAGGQILDGFATKSSAAEWIDGLGERLPLGGTGDVRLGELVALRTSVRQALQATLAGIEPHREVVEALNAASGRAPSFLAIHSGVDGLVGSYDTGAATREDLVMAALASDTVLLLTGPRRGAVQACGAPGCVLLYLKSTPRQAWCSAACGNRARQARHYRRSHRESARKL